MSLLQKNQPAYAITTSQNAIFFLIQNIYVNLKSAVTGSQKYFYDTVVDPKETWEGAGCMPPLNLF